MVATGGREFDAGNGIRHGLTEAVSEEVAEPEVILELRIQFPATHAAKERSLNEHGFSIERFSDLSHQRVGGKNGGGGKPKFAQKFTTGQFHRMIELCR